MRNRNHYKPQITSTLDVSLAADLGVLPTLWAIPGYLPCHHLSAIVAPTGQGLTSLATLLCAHLAPQPNPQSPIADLQSQFPNPSPYPLDPCTFHLAPDSLHLAPQPNPQSPIADPQSQIPNPSHPSPTSDVSALRSPPSALPPDPDPPLPAVLYLAGRERADSLRARLAAAGADLARILILTEVKDESPDSRIYRPIEPRDFRLISEVLHEYKSIRLVLIDNAEDIFFATNRPTRNKVLRQLACFRALAESREVAVTFLTAIPALQSDPFRNTFLCALLHTCRTLHLLAPDLESPIPNLNSPIPNPLNSPAPSASLAPCSLPLAPVHSSLPPSAFGPPSSTPRLLFTIKNTLTPAAPTLRIDLSRPLGISAFRSPLSALPLTYPHYLALRAAPQTAGPKPIKHDHACQVLLDLLKPGPLPVGHPKKPGDGTIRQLTQSAGLKWDTVQRAMDTLKIKPHRTGDHWSWKLPNTIPQLPATPLSTVSPKPHSEISNPEISNLQSEISNSDLPNLQSEISNPSCAFRLQSSSLTSPSCQPNSAQPLIPPADPDTRATPDKPAHLFVVAASAATSPLGPNPTLPTTRQTNAIRNLSQCASNLNRCYDQSVALIT